MNLHLVVEAQAHLCKDDKLSWISSIHPGCTVAIGLEAYDDAVLRFHVNKGFNLKTWHTAVERLRKNKLKSDIPHVQTSFHVRRGCSHTFCEMDSGGLPA